MKGFLQEYGIIMVVVAVVLGMLAFGKTGYAKGIQNAILGSADHIVEAGENVTKKQTGDIIKIEGKEYIVIERKEKDKVLVMNTKNARTDSFYDDAFYNRVRPDGQYSNTYENSDADKYLENTWYNYYLSSTMKAAIQPVNIKQVSYGTPAYGEEKNDTVYNTINRHVFLPSVEEIKTLIDTSNPEKVKAFAADNSEGRYHCGAWTRDSSQYKPTYVMELDWWKSSGGLSSDSAHYNSLYLYPTFVIDLSKVDYTEAGHVDYK